MPRPPRPGAVPRPNRRRGGERGALRYDVWLTETEGGTVAEALGRKPDAAGIRSLALAAAMLMNEKGGDDDSG